MSVGSDQIWLKVICETIIWMYNVILVMTLLYCSTKIKVTDSKIGPVSVCDNINLSISICKLINLVVTYCSMYAL